MKKKTFSGTWHHAPEHRLYESGTYMVTGGAYEKLSYLSSDNRKDEFLALLFELAKKLDWKLQAWAVLNNHYHFVGFSPLEGDLGAQSLRTIVSELHRQSARKWNRQDKTSGRKIWHNYWDSHITFQRSFYARLKYVHDNPVHHGLVDNAANYRWCSRAWVEKNGTPAFVKTLDSFQVDRINVRDDF